MRFYNFSSCHYLLWKTRYCTLTKRIIEWYLLVDLTWHEAYILISKVCCKKYTTPNMAISKAWIGSLQSPCMWELWTPISMLFEPMSIHKIGEGSFLVCPSNTIHMSKKCWCLGVFCNLPCAKLTTWNRLPS
jgi:hypothetical protein